MSRSDLLGMFRDTAAARKLIGYLTTPAAQEAWIRRSGSGAISVNRLVPLRDYPDPVSRKLARDLSTASSVRFDASDSMPQIMENAFNNAVLEYLDSPGLASASSFTASTRYAGPPTRSSPAIGQAGGRAWRWRCVTYWLRFQPH